MIDCDLDAVRIVAASGSFDNLEEVADWLGVDKNEGLFKFTEEHRPVPISIQAVGYRAAKNPFVFENSLNGHVIELIRDHSQGKPTLIFCSTQSSAQKCAENIVFESNNREFVTDEFVLSQLTSASLMVKNDSLKSVIMNGVGFHSAALDA